MPVDNHGWIGGRAAGIEGGGYRGLFVEADRATGSTGRDGHGCSTRDLRAGHTAGHRNGGPSRCRAHPVERPDAARRPRATQRCFLRLAEECVAVGGGGDTSAIVATTDGGAVWANQTVPSGISSLYDVRARWSSTATPTERWPPVVR